MKKKPQKKKKNNVVICYRHECISVSGRVRPSGCPVLFMNDEYVRFWGWDVIKWQNNNRSGLWVSMVNELQWSSLIWYTPAVRVYLTLHRAEKSIYFRHCFWEPQLGRTHKRTRPLIEACSNGWKKSSNLILWNPGASQDWLFFVLQRLRLLCRMRSDRTIWLLLPLRRVMRNIIPGKRTHRDGLGPGKRRLNGSRRKLNATSPQRL